MWRRTKLVQELRDRLREYDPRLPGRVRPQLRDVHHRAGQCRRPRRTGHRAQPGRSGHRVQGPGRGRASPRRPNATHPRAGHHTCRRTACSATATGTAGRAGHAHPHEIITSFPGLADISGAILLGEIGDDRTRFADDRALQAFAGYAPVTRASGKSRTVTRRRTKNNRLAAVGHCWAFTAAGRPFLAREHYLRRRARGDGHPAALRHLFNRMLGQLHHCLHTR